MQGPDMIADVTQFHRTFGHPVVSVPRVPHPDRQTLRAKLLRDEYQREFVMAWDKCAAVGRDLYVDADRPALRPFSPKEHAAALAEMGDVIADLIYYLIGTALEYGIPLGAIWNEVQRANMAKVWKELPPEGSPLRQEYTFKELPGPSPNLTGGWIGYDKDGKVVKPVGWQKPDAKIQEIVEEAMGEGI